jgi:hypothetical protein
MADEYQNPYLSGQNPYLVNAPANFLPGAPPPVYAPGAAPQAYAQNQNRFLGADNPFLTEKINLAQGDLARNYNLTQQPAYNAAILRSGSFGNSGVQQLNENAQRDLQANMGRISTDMRGADYQNQQNMYRWNEEFGRGLAQDQANQYQFGAQLGRGLSQDQQAQYQYGQNLGRGLVQDWQNDYRFNQEFGRNRFNDQTNLYKWDQEFNRNLYNDAYGQQQQDLQTQLGLLDRSQAYLGQDVNNANTIQNVPLNYWQQFSNQANAIGQGYGTTTQQGGGSNPWVSALGGAQLGSAIQRGWGSGGGWGGTPLVPEAAPGQFSLMNPQYG